MDLRFCLVAFDLSCCDSVVGFGFAWFGVYWFGFWLGLLPICGFWLVCVLCMVVLRVVVLLCIVILPAWVFCGWCFGVNLLVCLLLLVVSSLPVLRVPMLRVFGLGFAVVGGLLRFLLLRGCCFSGGLLLF